MGNKSQNNRQYSTDSIILGPDTVCRIRSKVIFEHGLDGLRLWDAGIVFSRYIFEQRVRLQGKTILELGTGVGIAGIVAKLHGQSARTLLTDYKGEVLQNCQFNLRLNQADCQSTLLDWVKPKQVGQFDFIFGSDVVYRGCPVKQLFAVMKQCLKPQGQVWLMLPARKNYEELCSAQLAEFNVARDDLSRLVYSATAEGDRLKYPLLASEESPLRFQLLALSLR